MMKVESGIKVEPMSVSGRYAEAWERMEAGDSFVVRGRPSINIFRVKATASGWSYVTRKIGDEEWRVWKAFRLSTLPQTAEAQKITLKEDV
jgi:hypothetical protein